MMRQKYPLLKFTIPLAVVIAAVGLAMFFMQGEPKDPAILVYTWLPAVAIALLGVAVRKKEAIEVPLPSDHIQQASRSEVDGILASLDEARAKGDMSETRYQKARAKVLAQAKGKK
ncbi:MAG: hypothetical protein V4510_02820 [bacterium]